MKILKVTREELYFSIIEFIKENGLSNFTYRKLAAYCGVSVGTIFNYFGDKDNIIENIMNDYWEHTFSSIINDDIKISKDFMKTLNDLYTILAEKSVEFNKIFGISKMSGIVQNDSITPILSKTVKVVSRNIAGIIDVFPDVKNKVQETTSLDEFSNYITNSFLMRIKDNRKDLGFFGIVLSDFLSSDSTKK